MNWFIVVVMTAQLNSAGLEETPLFIPFKTFETQDSCMDYATHNSQALFLKAWQQYEGKIQPKMLNCVTEDILRSIGETAGKQENEKNI